MTTIPITNRPAIVPISRPVPPCRINEFSSDRYERWHEHHPLAVVLILATEALHELLFFVDAQAHEHMRHDEPDDQVDDRCTLERKSERPEDDAGVLRVALGGIQAVNGETTMPPWPTASSISRCRYYYYSDGFEGLGIRIIP
jgi:hypothetical protein